MKIELKEGAILSETEMAIFNSIKTYADSDDRFELSVGDGPITGEPESWLLSMIYADNVNKERNGTDGLTKLTAIDHFFDEQYAKQFNNKGEGNYPADHAYALEQGMKKIGFTWSKDYSPEDVNYSLIDVFDSAGNYYHTVKVNRTEKGTIIETYETNHE